jgi:hypothetical protein
VVHDIARSDVLGTEFMEAGGRRSESDDLAWDDPAEVATLQNFFEFIDVESLWAVPTELNCAFETVQAIYHSERKVTRSDACVSKWMQSVNQFFAEGTPDLLNRILLTNKKIRGHQ